ncbi:MAG: hypothetical protein KJO07_19590 [Deltaproteobacteria bacterium]|jgi:hypothetical protein|nr:hypothetical protein [Deltaproteobacteria bacterium]
MAVDSRLPDQHRAPSPRARFRCDVCQRFVTATAHGVCPGCGREPLAASILREPTSRPVPWIYVFGLAVALFFLAVLAY